jgi:hypothetical protein
VRGSMVGGGAVGGCVAGRRSDAATVGGRWSQWSHDGAEGEAGGGEGLIDPWSESPAVVSSFVLPA